jgi:hypothetical protein
MYYANPPPKLWFSSPKPNLWFSSSGLWFSSSGLRIIIIIIILHSLVLVGQHGVRAQLCDRDTGERPQNPNYCQCVAHKVATKGESTHQLPCKLHPPSHTTAAHHTAIDTIPLRA